MGGNPCRLKIILDGGRAAGMASSIVAGVQGLSEEELALLTDDVAYPVIKRLITAESALEEAHNLLLDIVHYDGPRP